MVKYSVTVSSPVYESYRANRVRSLFNVDAGVGSSHSVNVDLPLEDRPWSIGLVVGPSGTGKTTLGGALLGGGLLHRGFEWGREAPVIDELSPGGDFDEITGALSAVGLGSVPSWLRPFHALSMGEQFRAELARVILERPPQIILDEFTSVVDRQIAKIGASAFAKAWRRGEGQCIALSCHYDIEEWLCPDWVLDTASWEFRWGSLRRSPRIPIDVYETSSSGAWRFFKPHHYLDLPMPVAPNYYIAEVDGVPVGHMCVSTMAGMKTARFTRLVIMPEWQGAGVGMKFLDYVAQRWLDGENRYGKKMTGIMHTSHPGLVGALNRSPRWVLSSQQMGGVDKVKSAKSMKKSARGGAGAKGVGYGGHLRAVNGFRYVGDRA
jgi:GNAT superfamily N-acetyltransferase